ncbi:MAG: helix-turn-helix domain-containing protein, partial [Candidatus Sumerlaeota bacterium]
SIGPPTPTLPTPIRTVRTGRQPPRLTEFSVKTVRRWIDRGWLPSHKLGGARVVRMCDLRTFLDEQAGEANKGHA